MRATRQQKILEIITTREIYTQEGILEELKKAGFDVTQATVSRDIKKLNLIKKLTAEGKYIYAQQERDDRGQDSRFRSMLGETVISVDHAMNIVVMKCHVGMANAACAAFDTMHWDGVVGTLAGDDTIFVLLRTEEKAIECHERIQSVLNK